MAERSFAREQLGEFLSRAAQAADQIIAGRGGDARGAVVELVAALMRESEKADGVRLARLLSIRLSEVAMTCTTSLEGQSIATLYAILVDLTRDCSYRHMPHRPTRLKNLGACQAYFPDLHAPTRPPDLPPGMRRPVLVHDNHKPEDDPPFRRRQNVRPTK